MSITSQQLESIRKNPDRSNAFSEFLQSLKGEALKIYDNPDDRAQTLPQHVVAQNNRSAIIDLFDRAIADAPDIMKAFYENTPDEPLLDLPNYRAPDAGSREDLRQKLGREPVLAQGGEGGGEDVPSERRTFGQPHTQASLKAEQAQAEKDRLAREKQADAQVDLDRDNAQRDADQKAALNLQRQRENAPAPKSSFDDDRAEQKAEEEAARQREADRRAAEARQHSPRTDASHLAHGQQSAKDQAADRNAAEKLQKQKDRA